jgi:guanosine-3',5'-bis(diphosphate) 3'-pyrophosphohydrolase
VWKAISDNHLNILRSETLTSADQVSRMRFEFELADPTHLDSLLVALKRVDGVYDAYRIVPGKS